MFDSILKIVFSEKPSVSMEFLKIAFQAAIAVGIFFLGARHERRLRREAEKKTLSNIRKIFYKELKRNYLLIIGHMPQKKPIQKIHMAILVDVLKDELPSSVYEEYLDRLAELPTEEMDKIYDAYTHIRECVKMGQQTKEEMERYDSIEARVKSEIIIGVDLPAIEEGIGEQVEGNIKYCEAALESISMALLLFEDGKESLDALQKERGKQLEAVDKYIELTGEK